jgi:hypothetical protein
MKASGKWLQNEAAIPGYKSTNFEKTKNCILFILKFRALRRNEK